MEIKKIGVAGAGAMGLGIAQVFAQAKFEVILFDVNTAQLEKAKTEIEKKNRAPAGSTYGPTRSKTKTNGHRTKRQRNEQYDKYGFRKIGTLWDISTQALAEDIRRSDPSR